MKKMFLPAIVLLLLSTPQWALASDHIGMLTGKWSCHSRVLCIFYGDMTIDSDTINFKKAGSIHYKVIKATENQITMELDRAPDCGRFINVGPYKGNENSLDFAVFKTKEDALAVTDADRKRKIHPHCCTWGVYDRSRQNVR